VDARVYANIFGESSLNDGVAFVLYKYVNMIIFVIINFNDKFRTIIGFQTAEVTGLSIFVAVLKVIYIFFGSIIVAVVVGLLNAIVSRSIILTLEYSLGRVKCRDPDLTLLFSAIQVHVFI
jgi:NhaP-type Na+/H+ or K+/H+ antiporter